MKKILLVAVLAAFAIPVWLLWGPSKVQTSAWTPPPAPKLEGVYAPNQILRDVQRLAVGVGTGPEGLAIDAIGRVYTGYDDGRVIRLERNGASYVDIGNTGGRPLGIDFDHNGDLVVADAKKGLLRFGVGSQAEALATSAADLPFGFTDDIDRGRYGQTVYFTDASSKFPYPAYLTDLFAHGANGRLLRYNNVTHKTTVLLDGLYFANGVAVGPDDQYVLVAETGAYRITRFWLSGPKAGTHDIFIDNLPGFPDNISFNGADRFWVALPALRDPQIDALAGRPLLRKVLARLPGFVQHWLSSKPKHSFVIGLDLDGKVIANLQDDGPQAYAPITSVEEQSPWLYFGSLTEPAIARLPLNRIVPGAPPAPSDLPPAKPEHKVRQDLKEESEDLRKLEDSGR